MDDQLDSVDFALAAYRDDDEWQVEDIASPAFESVEALSHALRRLPGDGRAVAMVAVDEDFFVIVRIDGPRTRVLLSDITAADDGSWPSRPWSPRHAPVDDPTTSMSRPPVTSTCSPTSGCTRLTWACCSTTTAVYPDEMLCRRSPRRPASTSSSTSLRCTRVPADRGAADAPGPGGGRAPRWRPATCRSAPSSVDAEGDVLGSGRNAREAVGRPHRARRGLALRAAAPPRGEWRLPAAPSWSPSNPARCAPARRARPGRPAGLRRLRRQGGRRRLAVGRRARPAAQPPSRGRGRRAGRRVETLLDGFFAGHRAESPPPTDSLRLARLR